MSRSFLSVSEFSSLLKQGIESLFPYPIVVKGEVSNLKVYPSGHCYFSLKDDRALVSCVMWASQVEKMRFLGEGLPKDGDDVLATSRVGIYPGRGQYQLSVLSIEPFGKGEALLKLEELKKKLAAEGLFDESRKRKIPRFPASIGVIAGQGSAGMKDILTNLVLRWPLTEVKTFPSLVQGKGAPKSLLSALSKAIEAKVDTIIIGRGGGSNEDLGAFNDEEFVRAVSSCPIPVISAVGHEVDTTLVDFVSDLRVSTPTGAAVAAVPDQNEIERQLDEAQDRMVYLIAHKIERLEKELASLANRPVLQKPENIYLETEKRLSQASKLLAVYSDRILAEKTHRVSSLKERLDALSPKHVLNRGYTMTLGEDGKPIQKTYNLKKGSIIRTILRDGTVISRVEAKEINNGK